MTNLEKAKKDYPRGTKFISIVTGLPKIVHTGDYDEEMDGDITADGNYVYKNDQGEWATITYFPTYLTITQTNTIDNLINSITLT